MASRDILLNATPGRGLLRRPEVSRLLLIALLAEIAYAVLNISTMTVYLRDDRQFGESVVGIVLVSFLFFEAVFKSPMGHLADRFGPKRLMLIGPSMSVATALLSLAVPHTNGQPSEVLCFVLLRAFDGLGAAMLWPAAFSAMNEAVDDGERQQAMSLLNLCYMLGVAIAFPLGGAVDDLAHVRWAGLILAAGMFAVVAAAVWRFIPEFRPQRPAEPETSEVGIKDFVKSMRQIPAYLLLAAVTFAGIGFPMAIFKLFPQDQFHFSETQVGFLILPAAASMALFSVPMSKFGEKLGRARAVHSGLAVCVVGMCIVASGMWFPGLRLAWILALGAVPVGFGFLLAIPAWMASVSDIDPCRRGTNLGAVMTAQGLGAIIGAPLGSSLYEKLKPVGQSLGLGAGFGRYSPFAGCAVCLFIGWLLSLRILREPR